MEQLFESMGKTRGIAILILNAFEDVLAEHDIKIPDVEREGEEDEACIYGSTYYELEDKITEILCNFIDE